MDAIPSVVQNYCNYVPEMDITPTVQLLLRYVPAKYLAGLRYIELTNSTSTRKLRRGKTWSRRKKVRLSDGLGIYCGDHIQILVDNLLHDVPFWVTKIPLTRAYLVATVLYHEIGHHIHRTQQPAYHEPEDVADEWMKRLRRSFVAQRYRYLRPVARPLLFIIRYTRKRNR